MALVVALEPAHHAGPLSLIHAAEDELDRRYGLHSDPVVPIDEFAAPLGRFLVARDDGALVGGVGFRRIGEPTRHVGEVKRLWTRPDRRRQGLAGLLMANCEDAAREMGLRALYLEAGEGQPEALAFYRRSGWTVTTSFPAGSSCHARSKKFVKSLTVAG